MCFDDMDLNRGVFFLVSLVKGWELGLVGRKRYGIL